jgi:hypothetical protein
MTLFQSRIDLLAYLASLLLLVFGFAFAGHLCFGFSSAGFHNVGASMSTLLRFPLGDFDYDSQMGDTRPSLAPWFFVAFLAMIFLVSMNIAIAIITEYFDEVHQAIAKLDRWKETSTSIDEVGVGSMHRRLGGGWSRCTPLPSTAARRGRMPFTP